MKTVVENLFHSPLKYSYNHIYDPKLGDASQT